MLRNTFDFRAIGGYFMPMNEKIFGGGRPRPWTPD
jgi:hypothetical protein